MPRPILSALATTALAVCLALPASASDQFSIDLTISAGKLARSSSPASVRVNVPKAFTDATVVLTDSAGHELPAQLTPLGLAEADAANGDTLPRDLHFIVDKLDAGATMRLHAVLSPASATSGSTAADSAAAFHWTEVPSEHILLTFGTRKVIDYIDLPFKDTKADRVKTYKPFHQVYNPEGTQLVSKGVGGQDTHHRGLFYGFSRVTYDGGKQTANTWQCTGGSYESAEGLLASAAGPVVGRQLVAIDWHGDNKKTFAHEEREITVYAVPGGTLLDFTSRLKSADGTIHLDGDSDNPHHAGFHFRAADEVATKTHGETYYLRPDAIGKPGKEVSWSPNHTDPHSLNQPWKGMSFVVGGKRYTAAILDRPDNPKESRWSERAYGRFGSFFVADVTPEKPLTVRYRFWLQDGETTQDHLAALDADFVEPVTVAVETK